MEGPALAGPLSRAARVLSAGFPTPCSALLRGGALVAPAARRGEAPPAATRRKKRLDPRERSASGVV